GNSDTKPTDSNLGVDPSRSCNLSKNARRWNSALSAGLVTEICAVTIFDGSKPGFTCISRQKLFKSKPDAIKTTSDKATSATTSTLCARYLDFDCPAPP